MSVQHQPPKRGPASYASAIRDRLRRRTARLGCLVTFLLLGAAALAVFAVCACKSLR